MEGNPRHEAVLNVGSTPAILVSHGLPELPLTITGKTVDKIFFDHGIKKGLIERLHSLISSPQTIYKAAPPHHAGSVVVTLEMHKGCPVIISIRASKQFGRNVYANEITSMYAKEGGSFEKRWAADGLLIWTKNNPKLIHDISALIAWCGTDSLGA